MNTSWWRSVTRAVSWHRRRLAAVAAAVAVGATIMAVRPAPAPTVPVVVAAADLPSGVTVSDEHLTVARWPAGTVPDRAVTDPTAVHGRLVAAPLTKGSPLTEASVITPHTGAAGRVLVPITLADRSVLSVLRVGDRIDLLAAGPEGPITVATSARVAALPHQDSAGGGLFESDGAGSPLLVEVSESEAPRLAGVPGSNLSVVLR
ncbi:SAF domain-containing protein [Enemella sp. A6]|uniref:SAF domain-containing protein n=1 Tax=Enemella sp. A6 TaxID=3440152 RepID=UPI003EB6C0E3